MSETGNAIENEVAISLETYGELLDLRTRVHVAVERMVNDEYINVEDILRILGTREAIDKANEIREQDKRRKEEYERKKREEAE